MTRNWYPRPIPLDFLFEERELGIKATYPPYAIYEGENNFLVPAFWINSRFDVYFF